MWEEEEEMITARNITYQKNNKEYLYNAIYNTSI